jgi:PAS domain S-box-containing protein
MPRPTAAPFGVSAELPRRIILPLAAIGFVGLCVVPAAVLDPGSLAWLIGYLVLAIALGVLAVRVRAVADRGARFWELSGDLLAIASRDGYVKRVNPAWTRLLGWRADELLARPIAEFIHPDDYPALATELGRLRDGDGVVECRARYRCRDGDYRSILWSVTMTAGDGLLYSIGRDVTETEEATAQLRESREFLNSVLDNIPSIVYVKDAEHLRFAGINPAGERMLGRTRDDVVGFGAEDLVDGDTAGRLAAAERDALAAPEGAVTVAQEHVRTDAGPRVLHTRRVAIRDPGGAPRYLLGISEDVTDQWAAEREAGVARDEAERANQAKNEFLSRMSHELRTPLNAVIGFGQLLQLDELSHEQEESVDQILKAGRHLLELINEVLDISRIESGSMSMSVSLVPVHVGSALADALSLIRPIADAAGVRLVADPAESLALRVHADTQRLRQVLINLLSNAVKYNRPGGSVIVRCSQPAPGRSMIAVADTGLGMTEEQLRRVFTPFDRLGAECTEVEGTGLGLSLSRGLLEAMGGTIAVRSTPGEGTTMLVELAAARPADDVPPPDEAAPAAPPAGDETRHVLYIEDNLANLRLVERALEGEHVRLLPAMQGNFGLELAAQYLPDLIVLDLHLPDMHGGEVLAALKSDPLTREIPVVILSADATPQQIDGLLADGAVRYLTKPIDVSYLRDVVRDTVRARAPATSR